MNAIRYAVRRGDGDVISEVNGEYAWPVLDYEAIGKDGDYTAPFEYDLEKFPKTAVYGELRYLYWTKRIPTEVKNLHRAFWGMPAVKPIPNEDAILEKYWKRHARVLE